MRTGDFCLRRPPDNSVIRRSDVLRVVLAPALALLRIEVHPSTQVERFTWPFAQPTYLSCNTVDVLRTFRQLSVDIQQALQRPQS
jgi:hypothetical protein